MSIEKIYNEIKGDLYEKVADKLNSLNATETFENYKKNCDWEITFEDTDWITETEVNTFYEVVENDYNITDKETIDNLYDYILEDVYINGEKHDIPLILYKNIRIEQLESQYNKGLLTEFEKDLLILNI